MVGRVSCMSQSKTRAHPKVGKLGVAMVGSVISCFHLSLCAWLGLRIQSSHFKLRWEDPLQKIECMRASVRSCPLRCAGCHICTSLSYCGCMLPWRCRRLQDAPECRRRRRQRGDLNKHSTSRRDITAACTGVCPAGIHPKWKDAMNLSAGKYMYSRGEQSSGSGLPSARE